jgi:6-phosphogluconolactonase
MRKLHIYTTAEETIAALADFFIETAKQTMRQRVYVIFLFQGEVRRKNYMNCLRRRATRALCNGKNCTSFWDERYVKSNDSSYNGLMVSRALFEPLNISEEQIFLLILRLTLRRLLQGIRLPSSIILITSHYGSMSFCWAW